jgi:hypothetical protein
MADAIVIAPTQVLVETISIAPETIDSPEPAAAPEPNPPVSVHIKGVRYERVRIDPDGAAVYRKG